MLECTIIAAIDNKNGIGKDNTLPWKIPEDMKRFKQITTYAPENMLNAVIMGWRTWQSLGCVPLQQRMNCIITRQKIENQPCFTAIEECFEYLTHQPNIYKIFVIGGSQIYHSVIHMKECTTMLITHIPHNHNCDTFFPIIDEKEFKIISSMIDGELKYIEYKKI